MKRSSSPLFWLFVATIVLALVILQHTDQLNLKKLLPPLNQIPALASSLDQAQASTGPYSVVGKPTISASFINRVLAASSSPAANTGAALYGLGVKYGIDPAFALAFFQHESGYGTAGMARTTLSLGNIRCTPGYLSAGKGSRICQDGYRAYSSWAAGYEDWYKLIRNLYVDTWHLSTVAQIVPTYAPAGDNNDPTGYINAVENAVDNWRSGRI